MGFLRQFRISSYSRKVTKELLMLMGSWKDSDPEMYPGTGEMLESFADELVQLSLILCKNDDDKLSILKGVRKGLLDAGVSKGGAEKIVSLLSPRVMDGKPERLVSDELLEVENRKPNSENEVKLEVVRKSCLFIDASLILVNNDDLNKEVAKIGSCLFFVGATKKIATEHSLSAQSFLDVAYDVLIYHGLSSNSAQHLIENLRGIASEPFGKNAMEEGEKSLESFLNGHDAGALKLKRLVDEWKNMRSDDL